MQSNALPQLLTAHNGIPQPTSNGTSHTDSSDDDYEIFRYIEIFGRINHQRAAMLIGDTPLRERFIAELKNHPARFFKVLPVALKAFDKNTPEARAILSEYYQLSIVSADQHEERVQQDTEDMISYLLSAPMPYQESRFWGCHCIKAIQMELDTHQRDLEEIITLLFQITIQGQLEIAQKLSPKQEQLLFKCVALLGNDKQAVTWGQFLFQWIKSYQERRWGENIFQPDSKLHKLLTLDEITQPRTFQEFVYDETVAFLWKTRRFLLPPKLEKQDLYAIIKGSIKGQLACVYFINHLYNLILQNMSRFPFEGAYERLKDEIEDHLSLPFCFLYTCLYTLNCKYSPLEPQNNPPLLPQAVHHPVSGYEDPSQGPYSADEMAEILILVKIATESKAHVVGLLDPIKEAAKNAPMRIKSAKSEEELEVPKQFVTDISRLTIFMGDTQDGTRPRDAFSAYKKLLKTFFQRAAFRIAVLADQSLTSDIVIALNFKGTPVAQTHNFNATKIDRITHISYKTVFRMTRVHHPEDPPGFLLVRRDIYIPTSMLNIVNYDDFATALLDPDSGFEVKDRLHPLTTNDLKEALHELRDFGPL